MKALYNFIDTGLDSIFGELENEIKAIRATDESNDTNDLLIMEALRNKDDRINALIISAIERGGDPDKVFTIIDELTGVL